MTQPEQPQMVEVCIDTPGPTVTVKAAVDLDTAASKAMELFKEAYALNSKTSPGPGFGLQNERDW